MLASKTCRFAPPQCELPRLIVQASGNAGALIALAAVVASQSMARRLYSPATASFDGVIDDERSRCAVDFPPSPAISQMCVELPRTAPRSLAVAAWYNPPVPAVSHSSLLTGFANSRSLGRLWSTTKVNSHINAGLFIRSMTSASISMASRALARARSRTICGAFGRYSHTTHAPCMYMQRLVSM